MTTSARSKMDYTKLKCEVFEVSEGEWSCVIGEYHRFQLKKYKILRDRIVHEQSLPYAERTVDFLEFEFPHYIAHVDSVIAGIIQKLFLKQ